jgi:hypothetical protein
MIKNGVVNHGLVLEVDPFLSWQCTAEQVITTL